MLRGRATAWALSVLAAACRSQEPERTSASAVSPTPSASAAPVGSALPALPSASTEPDQGDDGQWLDPLSPSRPAWRSAGRPSADWVRAPPRRELQYQRSEAERGLLPCEARDPGAGAMGPWQHLRPLGQIALPTHWQPEADGSFDLLVHFHGQRPALKELARSGEEVPLLALSLGIGAAYAPPFRDRSLFEQLVSDAERIAARSDVERFVGRSDTERFVARSDAERFVGRSDAGTARVRRLALAGWSRGYDAIAEILAQPLGARVDALILLDGLHAPRDPGKQAAALAPFVTLAERAQRGEAFVFVSFSSIPTDGYASTTETAHALLAAVGGIPEYVTRDDPLGLELREVYSRGNLHLRGYAGNGRLDHCAQFGAYPDALRGLARFWRERARAQ